MSIPIIAQVYIRYELDFKLFGYNLKKYLYSIGLGEKFKDINTVLKMSKELPL